MTAAPRLVGLLVSAALHLSIVSVVWLGSSPTGGAMVVERPVAVRLAMFDAPAPEVAAPPSQQAEAVDRPAAQPLSGPEASVEAEPAGEVPPSGPDISQASSPQAETPEHHEGPTRPESPPAPEATVVAPEPRVEPLPAPRTRPATRRAHEATNLTPRASRPASETIATPPESRAVQSVASTLSESATSVSTLVAVPSGTRPGSAAASQQDDYLAEVSAKINANKRYPRKARRRGEEGTVVVRVVIERDGRFSELEVATSSGSERLDGAALAALHKAAPFRPIPPSLGRSRWAIDVPIVFHLRR